MPCTHLDQQIGYVPGGRSEQCLKIDGHGMACDYLLLVLVCISFLLFFAFTCFHGKNFLVLQVIFSPFEL